MLTRHRVSQPSLAEPVRAREGLVKSLSTVATSINLNSLLLMSSSGKRVFSCQIARFTHNFFLC